MNGLSEPTRDEFLKWRSPVRGTQNPQRMENPFWAWCVRTRESAYAANQKFDGPSSFDSSPCWCFDRFGQARVDMPDGREVYIGGEHEDHYDPDFYVYNDVVVIGGDEIVIHGYPETLFPPTDFHSATLVDSDIFLIGNLGYPDDRVPGATQVLRLDVDTWQISSVPTGGVNPGWIHGHAAEFSESNNAIVVTGGSIYDEYILENIDDYQLCLKTLAWSKITDREWGRWIMQRADGEINRLWEIRSASWTRELGMPQDKQFQDLLPDLPVDLLSQLAPVVSDDQIEQIKTLYQSPFTSDIARQDSEDHRRFRLDIQGTTVRFDEDMFHIVVTVEGQLPAEIIDSILCNLQNRLSSVESAAYTVTRIKT